MEKNQRGEEKEIEKEEDVLPKSCAKNKFEVLRQSEIQSLTNPDSTRITKRRKTPTSSFGTHFINVSQNNHI